MRIVELISGLGRGGAERALASRLKYAPSNIETLVICTSEETSDLESQVEQHAHLYRKPRSPLKTLNSLDPDIIITHNPREAIRVLGHPWISQRIPTVVVAHNEISSETPLKSALLDPILTWVNNRAAAHIAVSSRAAQGMQCRNARSISICLLGSEMDLDIGPKTDVWPADAKIRVLVLGRFSRQKNLETFLDAVTLARSALAESHVQICLVGEGHLEESLRRRIASQGLQDLIAVVGWVEPADSVIAGSDVLFIPSHHEGGPLTLYEALLAGRVVIATPVGAVPDVREILIRQSGHSGHLHVLADSSLGAITRALIDIPSVLSYNAGERISALPQFLDAKVTANRFYALCFTARDQFIS